MHTFHKVFKEVFLHDTHYVISPTYYPQDVPQEDLFEAKGEETLKYAFQNSKYQGLLSKIIHIYKHIRN